MRVAFVTPPPIKPAEPGVSAGAAAHVARRLGVKATSIDASIGWYRFALAEERLAAALEAWSDQPRDRIVALRRAARNIAQQPSPLQRPQTYADRRVYTSAIDHLETALRLAVRGFDGFQVGIGSLAMVDPPRRLESSALLAELAGRRGPFDDYFVEELIPQLERAHFTGIGVSLTFQHQAPAAFRLAALLAEHLPGVERVLGGPLVDCWAAVEVDFERAPFCLFDRVLAGGEAAIGAWVGSGPGGEGSDPGPAGPLAVGLEEAPWDDYFAPLPIVPAALGRGCYWRRCTFCPDHLHPSHRPCDTEALGEWLRAVAQRFPRGAMLHLTDSALPPAYLQAIAEVIAREGLPLQWHGFVRVEEELARPSVARQLAEGGCAMLQLGVETGSPDLLTAMGKGADPEQARRMLHATAAAGIRNQVYLLFGMPRETDADRELTLALIEDTAACIHAINPALLNLPRRSPMHDHPQRFGISELIPFGTDTDLSLYDDFRCGESHPRTEARRWLDHRFFKSPAVRRIRGHLRSPFKANHLCFL